MHTAGFPGGVPELGTGTTQFTSRGLHVPWITNCQPPPPDITRIIASDSISAFAWF